MKSRKYNEYTQPDNKRIPLSREEKKVTRESTCSEDIYCNTSSPEETAPGIPIIGKKKVSTVKTAPIAKKQSEKLDTNVEAEGFYTSLDLSQREEQDVYEAQLAIKSEKIKPEDKTKTEVLPMENKSPPEPDIERGCEEVRPSNKIVLYLKSNSKEIAAMMCFFFLTFVASMFGSLIIGSVMMKKNEITLNNFENNLNNFINIIQNQTKQNEAYNTTNP